MAKKNKHEFPASVVTVVMLGACFIVMLLILILGK